MLTVKEIYKFNSNQGRKSVFNIGGILGKYDPKSLFLDFLGDDLIDRNLSIFSFIAPFFNLKNPVQTSKSAWISNQLYKFLAYFLYSYFSTSKCPNH